MRQKSIKKYSGFGGDGPRSEFDNLFESSNLVNESRREQRKNRFW